MEEMRLAGNLLQSISAILTNAPDAAITLSALARPALAASSPAIRAMLVTIAAGLPKLILGRIAKYRFTQ